VVTIHREGGVDTARLQSMGDVEKERHLQLVNCIEVVASTGIKDKKHI
jgi:hypothetical protein